MVTPRHLRKYDFFDFMGDKELEAVAAITKENKYRTGDVIIEAGEPAETFFFLVAGSVAYYCLLLCGHYGE